MKKTLVLLMAFTQLFSLEINIVDAYEKALEYEATLQSQKYQTLAKKEEINMAKAALYPQIDMQVNATQRDYKLNFNGNKRKEQYYSATLSARLDLYKPENYNNIDQSKIKYQYSKYYFEQQKQDLALNIADAYTAILRAQNALLVAQVYVEANEIRYNQIKSLYEKRLSNRMDLLESKVTYDSSKVKVNSEQHNLFLAKLKLKNLTGLQELTFPSIDLEKLNPDTLVLDFSLADLDDLNLEVKKSMLGIDLATKQQENARYGHYPKVDLSASYSKYDTDSIYTDYTNESRVMLNFRLPLYQGGYVESRIAQTKYLALATRDDLRDVQKKAHSQYEEFSIQLANAKENIVLYNDAKKSAKLYLHAVEEGYARGLKNLIDLEDAKTKLFENKFRLIDSSYEYIKSYVSLLALYGQLDRSRLEHLSDILSKQ